MKSTKIKVQWTPELEQFLDNGYPEIDKEAELESLVNEYLSQEISEYLEENTTDEQKLAFLKDLQDNPDGLASQLITEEIDRMILGKLKRGENDCKRV